MAEKSTWVKIDRNILDWGWYQDANTMRVFIHLLLKANIKANAFMGVTVHRGQLVTSYDTLSRELKLSNRSIRTAIKHLKMTGEVTSKVYPKFSLITVLNYDKYQGQVTSETSGKRQASDKQVTGKRQQSKNIRMEECKNKNIEAAEPLNWEKNIPEEFRGLFASEAAWIEFCNER